MHLIDWWRWFNQTQFLSDTTSFHSKTLSLATVSHLPQCFLQLLLCVGLLYVRFTHHLMSFLLRQCSCHIWISISSIPHCHYFPRFPTPKANPSQSSLHPSLFLTYTHSKGKQVSQHLYEWQWRHRSGRKQVMRNRNRNGVGGDMKSKTMTKEYMNRERQTASQADHQHIMIIKRNTD